MRKLSFAVIGGGPAGFYISKCLSKLPSQPIIHIFQKQFCPFGLIRYGVAPDHITIKKAETTLSSISNYQGFKYFGNQQVDQRFIESLRKSYSGVIYAFGAQDNNQPQWFSTWKASEKCIGNVINARDVVYWYNNHPKYESYKICLDNIQNVVIIGNGNVSIDIARIFLRKYQQLVNTQISQNALLSLKSSRIKNVSIIGRRGFTHSAFALKQIRQVSKLGIKIYCIEQQLQASMNESSFIECTSLGNHNAAQVRMNKRKIDFIKQKCLMIKKKELHNILAKDERKLIIRYLLDPMKIQNQNAIKFNITQLIGEPFKQIAQKTQKQQFVEFDLLINSTGFKVNSIISSQLDLNKNRVLNSDGCVLLNEDQSKLQLGQYAVGWCKSGAKGVIDQTLLGSQQTFNNIRIHTKNNIIIQKPTPQFQSRQNISFQKYLQLKQLELARGDKQKFIKKKLKFQELKQFFGK